MGILNFLKENLYILKIVIFLIMYTILCVKMYFLKKELENCLELVNNSKNKCDYLDKRTENFGLVKNVTTENNAILEIFVKTELNNLINSNNLSPEEIVDLLRFKINRLNVPNLNSSEKKCEFILEKLKKFDKLNFKIERWGRGFCGTAGHSLEICFEDKQFELVFYFN